MINRTKILLALGAMGIVLMAAAGPFYHWGWIVGDWYFKLYAIGVLCWALRMKMQAVSYEDAMVLTVSLWLCIFNVVDELISRTPAKPFKPWIFTTVILFVTYLTHRRKCKSNQKG